QRLFPAALATVTPTVAVLSLASRRTMVPDPVPAKSASRAARLAFHLVPQLSSEAPTSGCVRFKFGVNESGMLLFRHHAPSAVVEVSGSAAGASGDGVTSTTSVGGGAPFAARTAAR